MKDMKIILPVNCNAKCPFCFWEKKELFDKDYIGKLMLALSTLVSEDSITANISGGEPSLYKNFPLLFKALKSNEKIKKIIVTSNGSKLLQLVPEFIGNVNHVNISRHHFLDSINDKLFGVHFDIDYKKLTYELNKVGIDVRVNCVITDNIKSVCDLNNMINWAVDNGFNSIKFRQDFSKGTDMSDLEKDWRESYIAVNESSCPVCRINTYMSRIPVLFGYGVEEPSEVISDYEYVFTSSGKLCYDYKGNIEVKKLNFYRKYIPSGYIPCGNYTDTGCGRYITYNYGGCGAGGC